MVPGFRESLNRRLRSRGIPFDTLRTAPRYGAPRYGAGAPTRDEGVGEMLLLPPFILILSSPGPLGPGRIEGLP